MQPKHLLLVQILIALVAAGVVYVVLEVFVQFVPLQSCRLLLTWGLFAMFLVPCIVFYLKNSTD